MTKKDFKKGDRVTVIEDWDRKGLVSVRYATVHSCGAKVLRLTCDITGDEFGEALSPHAAAPGDVGARLLLTGDALVAEALAVSAGVIAEARADLNGRLTRRAGDRYVDSYVKCWLEALHPEPVWALYADLLLAASRR